MVKLIIDQIDEHMFMVCLYVKGQNFRIGHNYCNIEEARKFAQQFNDFVFEGRARLSEELNDIW